MRRVHFNDLKPGELVTPINGLDKGKVYIVVGKFYDEVIAKPEDGIPGKSEYHCDEKERRAPFDCWRKL